MLVSRVREVRKRADFMKMTDDITEAMVRVDRAAGKILDLNWPKAPGGKQAATDQEVDELLRASLSLLNKIRRDTSECCHADTMRAVLPNE